ncbi:putative membrane protein (plasmid) [Erwinia amylovora LA635]|uniref:Putative membrane protein n=1 Tax=Erwinia amylovora TaxID=552 RepID=A0A0P0ZHL6_ERWAM|nr:putative membrane protein [Erwinia amylovora LA635]CDK23821.1 hypothetical protein LA636_p1043 [Erwinia amylovora LA636]CDK23872.1 hypothetical protein LA637_p1045 [Erwinia amylovora LA637]CDM08170.1 putative membrane protein [Erwinia amylovora]
MFFFYSLDLLLLGADLLLIIISLHDYMWRDFLLHVE